MTTAHLRPAQDRGVTSLYTGIADPSVDLRDMNAVPPALTDRFRAAVALAQEIHGA
jgi:hypothetical protein